MIAVKVRHAKLQDSKIGTLLVGIYSRFSLGFQADIAVGVLPGIVLPKKPLVVQTRNYVRLINFA